MKKLIIIILLIALIAFVFYLIYNIKTPYYFNLENFTNVKVGLDGENVYLRDSCRKITFSVTQDQLMSIQFGLADVSYFRPLTHDLMKDIFDGFGIEVLFVEITEYKDETYHARLFLKQGNKILNLDSRPSDAIAIAIRYKKPVYVNKEIMEKQGINIC